MHVFKEKVTSDTSSKIAHGCLQLILEKSINFPMFFIDVPSVAEG